MIRKISAKIILLFFLAMSFGFNNAKAAVDGTLQFNQATVSANIGDTVTLIATVDPGTNAVDAVSLDISFDQDVLQLDSISAAAAFPTVLAGPTIDNDLGTGSIDVGNLSTPATTTSNVATFSFTALAVATDSAVSIDSSSDAAAEGEYIIATRTGSTVTITDVVAPTITAFTIPSTSTSLTVSVTEFTATDDTAVTGYMLTESSSAPASGDSGWEASAQSSYTFATEGTKTLYAWAKDAAGNVSTSLNDSVIITLPDITDPTVTAFTIPETATSLVVSISTFTATDDTAVTGYMVTESSSAPASGDSGWEASAQSSYTFATEGTKTLYAWAKDAAGNVSTSLNDSVVITLADTTDPVVTAFTIPSISTSLTISITEFTATDDTGVTGYMLTESSSAPSAGDSGWEASAQSSYTFTTQGTKTLYAWAKDAAGNVSTSLNDSVTITLPDTTAPTIDDFIIPASSTSLTITITEFTASDDMGVTGYMLTESASTPAAGDSGWESSAPSTYTFATEGDKTLYAWAKDAAGNISDSVDDWTIITLPEEEDPGEDPGEEEVVEDDDGNIEVSSPKIDLGDENQKMKKNKKVYTKNKKLTFKGTIEGLNGGTVKVYINGDEEGETEIDNDGEWKEKVKVKKDKTYEVKFKYFNSAGEEVDQSTKYRVKVDTKDPEFGSMPLVLNKRVGEKVWWSATDNDEIRYYKYYFNGKKVKVQEGYFYIPAGTPAGAHTLLIRAYDKAGNKEDKVVLVKVR